MSRQRPWYVVGFWPDTHQRFAENIYAESAQVAEDVIAAAHPGVAIAGVVGGNTVFSGDAEYAQLVRYTGDDETKAEELGRLRREITEVGHDTPEYRMILDRIAVLVREQAEARRERAAS